MMMEYSYELLLARQNLENAQNAKDTVRLTRDENGNMIYQYTTDQDKVAEAQQKFNDVLYEMNQELKKHYRDLRETIEQLKTEEADAINQILKDTTLGEEEQLARIEETKKRYGEQIALLEEQLNITTENMLINQQAFSERFNEDLIDNTNNTQQQINLTFEEMATDAERWNEAVDETIEQAKDALSDYKDHMNEVAEASQTDWENIVKKMQDYEVESEKARTTYSPE